VCVCIYIYMYIYLIAVRVKVHSTLPHIPKGHRIRQYLTYGLDVEMD